MRRIDIRHPIDRLGKGKEEIAGSDQSTSRYWWNRIRTNCTIDYNGTIIAILQKKLIGFFRFGELSLLK